MNLECSVHCCGVSLVYHLSGCADDSSANKASEHLVKLQHHRLRPAASVGPGKRGS